MRTGAMMIFLQLQENREIVIEIMEMTMVVNVTTVTRRGTKMALMAEKRRGREKGRGLRQLVPLLLHQIALRLHLLSKRSDYLKNSLKINHPCQLQVKETKTPQRRLRPPLHRNAAGLPIRTPVNPTPTPIQIMPVTGRRRHPRRGQNHLTRLSPTRGRRLKSNPRTRRSSEKPAVNGPLLPRPVLLAATPTPPLIPTRTLTHQNTVETSKNLPGHTTRQLLVEDLFPPSLALTAAARLLNYQHSQ